MENNLEKKLQFFATLNERQQRQFAAIEAIELGYHGVTVISKLYGIHKHTIRRGQKELEGQTNTSWEKIRIKGGGRKKIS